MKIVVSITYQFHFLVESHRCRDFTLFYFVFVLLLGFAFLARASRVGAVKLEDFLTFRWVTCTSGVGFVSVERVGFPR